MAIATCMAIPVGIENRVISSKNVIEAVIKRFSIVKKKLFLVIRFDQQE